MRESARVRQSRWRRREEANLRLARFVPALAALCFGLGAVVFGVYSFVRIDGSERQVEARLRSIGAGEIPPDALVVLRKYVNPGRRGLPHVVFRGAGQAKVDLTATPDFFNSVNPGQTVRAYAFADGYFIPENQRQESGGGKWFLLGLSFALGALGCSLAWATARLR
jgi:hypothetical protein